MSWLDYHPLIGPFRESFGGGDGEIQSGGEYGDARDVMMDGCYMCSTCKGDIAHDDTHCGTCGEVIEWEYAEGGE